MQIAFPPTPSRVSTILAYSWNASSREGGVEEEVYSQATWCLEAMDESRRIGPEEHGVCFPPTPSQVSTILASSWNVSSREGGAEGKIFPPPLPKLGYSDFVPSSQATEEGVGFPPTPFRALTIVASSWNASSREGGAEELRRKVVRRLLRS